LIRFWIVARAAAISLYVRSYRLAIPSSNEVRLSVSKLRRERAALSRKRKERILPPPSSAERRNDAREEKAMRFLVKISIPVEAGNAAVKKDGLKVIQKILEQQKPEAAYFIAEGGRRTGIVIIDLKDASEIPGFAEPWFLALNASIEATPAMVAEDLKKAAPAIEKAVKTYG
jgi:hypothetical protein